MLKSTGIYFVLVVLLAVGSSCSDFRALQKSTDWEEKYAGAKKYYEKGDYYRAAVLFEEVIPIIRGTREAEEAQFYNAYAHYYQKEYILSAYYFKNFATIYSRSEFAIEASYMHAYSLYLQSPDYNLDQTSTYEAITEMQNFINRYPYSEYIERATEIIDNLRIKLERKGFANAKQYYSLRQYTSAIIAFENFQKDFPDSEYLEEIAYLLIDTQYIIAERSISGKQKDRYNKAIAYYHDFLDKYPNSNRLSDAETLYEDSLNAISKLASKG